MMQEEFIEHNKLVKPRVIRESTNRLNIKYIVSLETGPGALVERAADLIIIYCRTREEVVQLADILKYPLYTLRSGTEEEKAAIISRWLGNRDQPVIVATSALRIGFNYPFVRWVIHVNRPDKLTDFSQESRRAGRDGSKASSIVLLYAGWKPQVNGYLSADREAMQLYLTQCQVYREPHTEARPADVVFTLPQRVEMEFTGLEEVLRQDHSDLEIMGRRFDYALGKCSRRFRWIYREDKEWIGRYVHEETECRFPDIVILLYYGVYYRPGGEEWLRKYFQRSFQSELEYMLWLGETASLGGNECIEANCVAALALAEFG
ncbi:hypothetical protein BKA64DRAFT_695677 [Cadophora sp. MPI-SDFR-AT-0126]|nr:hypothetical protein BKA64DRAFT_695677 [Leotiomycetes sp. MPI-SDFR-AT-0126]